MGYWGYYRFCILLSISVVFFTFSCDPKIKPERKSTADFLIDFDKPNNLDAIRQITLVEGILGNGLSVSSSQPASIDLSVIQNSLHKGSISLWFKLDRMPSNGELYIASLAFVDSPYLLMLYRDPTRVAFRLHNTLDSTHWDAMLPRYYIQIGRWIHALVTWDLSANTPEDFLHLYINGDDSKLSHGANDLQFTFPIASLDNMYPHKLQLNHGNMKKDEELEIIFDEIEIFGLPLSATDVLDRFLSLYGDPPRIVLEEDQLNHYLGRRVPDPEAQNGFAWATDATLAYTKLFKLLKGTYMVGAVVRYTSNAPPDLNIALLSLEPDGKKNNAINRYIKAGDLLGGHGYRPIEMPVVINETGTYSIALCTLVYGFKDFRFLEFRIADQKSGEILRTWDFNEIEHLMGEWVEDAKAPKGKAWANVHALAYGPYLELPYPGKYQAIFRVRIDPALTLDKSLATMDVFSHNGYVDHSIGTKSYGKAGFNGNSFPAPGEYTNFCIPFYYDGASMMEFRVLIYDMTPQGIFLDNIIIEKIYE